MTSVQRWLRADPDFKQAYDDARSMRGDRYGEQVSDIAMGVLAGKIDPNIGRVAGDLLKWSASRMAPSYYGDKLQQDIRVTDVNREHLEAVRSLSSESSPVLKVVGGNDVEG
jgi:hypothetical protein